MPCSSRASSVATTRGSAPPSRCRRPKGRPVPSGLKRRPSPKWCAPCSATSSRSITCCTRPSAAASRWRHSSQWRQTRPSSCWKPRSRPPPSPSSPTPTALPRLRAPRAASHVGGPEPLKGTGAAVRQAGVGSGPLPPGSGAVLVPLQYIGAAEMATILRPMVPPEALIRVDTVRNLLVLAGSRAQAEGWLDIISTFDVNLLKGMSVGVFPLKYVSVKEVEAALQWLSSGGAPRQNNQAADRPVSAIAMPGAAPAGTPAPPPRNTTQPAASPVSPMAMRGAAPGGTAAGPADNMPLPLAGAVRVLPIERINSILVVTPRAAYLDE